MSRIIKFRFMWKDTKKWYDDIGDGDNYSILNDDDFYVMQFTGLKDKNGKDIYEGDIVSNGTDKGNIFWHDSRAMFLVDNSQTDIAPMDDWSDFVIIGNIYENPELLKI